MAEMGELWALFCLRARCNSRSTSRTSSRLSAPPAYKCRPSAANCSARQDAPSRNCTAWARSSRSLLLEALLSLGALPLWEKSKQCRCMMPSMSPVAMSGAVGWIAQSKGSESKRHSRH
eukprot:scaffold3052_cov389-Prasinococcus_capsulatus_cf.AAC.9